MNNIDIKKYLSTHTLSSINTLEFLAKKIVEGFISGLHKSPFHGFSVEFSQHKPYIQGDNLRFMDWKVYARTDRYYIKQFEEETNLRCSLLLDISRSMEFKSAVLSKIQYASILTAALSYILLKQRDATGLVLFDEHIKKSLPPKAVQIYIQEILNALDTIECGPDTNINNALHTIAEKIKKRGLIILISDLLDDPEKILSGIKHLRYNQHEIIVFHIVDEQEINFNYNGEFIFVDLENNDKIKTDSRFIQEDYTQRFKAHCEFFKTKFQDNMVDYVLLKTSESIEKALYRFFLKRQNLY